MFLFVQSVADVDLQNLGSLEYLDLSRNLIKEILPGTFLGMQSLKGLDFSVNVVRKVDFLNKFNAFICYSQEAVLRIRDILVRIRIRGSVPLTIVSGS
jgi:hypothetical protein